MANESAERHTVSIKVVKQVKGIPTSVLKVVKKDASKEAAIAAVEKQQSNGVKHIEMLNEKTGDNTVFSKLLSGKNYSKKVVPKAKNG